MPHKGRNPRQNDVNHQDETNMLQPRRTTKDHPRTTHARSFMHDRGNTRFTTRTQVGKRIYNEYVQPEQAPSVRHCHQWASSKHGNIRSVGEAETQPTGQIQKTATGNQSHVQFVEDIRVNNDLVSGSIEQEDEEGSDKRCEIMEKETRGPTYMQSIWGRPATLPVIRVEYNRLGQPIGGESSKLCHFLGSIARNGKYCPIDIPNWHAMPMTKKNDMMDVVKLRFHVPVYAEKWILTSIGSKWRNWKHYLKTRYWLDIPIQHMIDDTDDRVLPEQWVKLLTYWKTEEAKKASDRNAKARKEKKMNQRTGKTSFAQIKARMTEENGRSPSRVELFGSCLVSPKGNSDVAISSTYVAMLERSNEVPEGSNVIAPNDIFAQIMGKDKPGHVRMLGHGICPSDIWSETPRLTSNSLVMKQQAEIEQLKATVLAQRKTLALQVTTRQDTPIVHSLSQHAIATQPLQVGTYVSLKSLFTGKVIAEGLVQSTDPSKKVGGQMLGENWCEVKVRVIVEPEEQLVRPYDTFQKLSHTFGEMIAWPCSLVTPT